MSCRKYVHEEITYKKSLSIKYLRIYQCRFSFLLHSDRVDLLGAHKHNLVSGGTQVLQTIPVDRSSAILQPPPDGGAVGFGLKTGIKVF